jgi:hypothetical protein
LEEDGVEDGVEDGLISKVVDVVTLIEGVDVVIHIDQEVGFGINFL